MRETTAIRRRFSLSSYTGIGNARVCFISDTVMLTFSLTQRILIATIAVAAALTSRAAPQSAPAPGGSIPRTVDGKPNLQGIWQASSSAGADLQDHAARNNMLAGRSVVVGGEIPYQPWAVAKKPKITRTA